METAALVHRHDEDRRKQRRENAGVSESSRHCKTHSSLCSTHNSSEEQNTTENTIKHPNVDCVSQPLKTLESSVLKASIINSNSFKTSLPLGKHETSPCFCGQFRCFFTNAVISDRWRLHGASATRTSVGSLKHLRNQREDLTSGDV